MSVPDHRAWVDSTYCRRYLVANRLGFKDDMSYGLTFDKGRRSGKDWLRGSIMGFESKNSVVLTPLVISDFRKNLCAKL